ncbi:MAG: hypothetical protein LBM19_04055 [Holosporales bacterium]|jgi:hypothetical protein|nr:hypothetical protein [Holosporales bacterium]
MPLVSNSFDGINSCSTSALEDYFCTAAGYESQQIHTLWLDSSANLLNCISRFFLRTNENSPQPLCINHNGQEQTLTKANSLKDVISNINNYFNKEVFEKIKDKELVSKIKNRLEEILDFEELEEDSIFPIILSFYGFGDFLIKASSRIRSTLKDSLIAMDDDGYCTLDYSTGLFFFYIKFKTNSIAFSNISEKEKPDSRYVSKYFSKNGMIVEFLEKLDELL